MRNIAPRSTHYHYRSGSIRFCERTEGRAPELESERNGEEAHAHLPDGVDA